MAAFDLITADYARSVGQIPAAFDDATVALYVTGASAAVGTWCKRRFVSAETTEYYSGSGVPDLCLKNAPVTAIAGVWLDPLGAYGSNPAGFGDGAELAA